MELKMAIEILKRMPIRYQLTGATLDAVKTAIGELEKNKKEEKE